MTQNDTLTAQSPLIRVNAIIMSVFTVGMIITAALAGNGIYNKGTDPWLVTGHQHLGNLLFALGVIQLVLAYLVFSKKQLSGSTMLVSAVVFVLTFAQIGLGYSTRNHMVDLVGWHIAVGVALTAASALFAFILWQAVSRRDAR